PRRGPGEAGGREQVGAPARDGRTADDRPAYPQAGGQGAGQAGGQDDRPVIVPLGQGRGGKPPRGLKTGRAGALKTGRPGARKTGRRGALKAGRPETASDKSKENHESGRATALSPGPPGPATPAGRRRVRRAVRAATVHEPHARAG